MFNMSASINKKTLEYLAELSRIELDKKNEEKLLDDLKNILSYFEQLNEIDTQNIEPLAGGTIRKNVFREDEKNIKVASSNLTEQFPEQENGFLKVPPVFE